MEVKLLPESVIIKPKQVGYLCLKLLCFLLTAQLLRNDGKVLDCLYV